LHVLRITKSHFGQNRCDEGRGLPEATVGHVKVYDRSVTLGETQALINSTKDFYTTTESRTLTITNEELPSDRDESRVARRAFAKQVIKEVYIGSA
jgi:hypothetical protein